MENQFEKLIEKYEDSQKILLRGFDNTLVFYIAQSVNDKALMEHSLEKGIRNNLSDNFINTILDAFES
tara:strand:- start:1819 stop:2022 length:204 start_codon:yes stop_codon:yes gene_type:complete